MHTLTRLLAVALVAALAWSHSPATRASEPLEEIVVVLGPNASIDAVNAHYGCLAAGQIPGTGIHKLQVIDAGRVLARMRHDPALIAASRNGRVRRHQTAGFPHSDPEPVEPGGATPPSELYAAQLNRGALATLGLGAAGAFALGRPPCVVAVLDTGVDVSHPAVAPRLWRNEAETPNGVDDDGNGYVDDLAGYDFVDGDADPAESAVAGDAAGHGTFVAGLVALAAPNARVMPVRVLDPEGDGTVFGAAEAVAYAARNGAKVICMSFGANPVGRGGALRIAIASARSLGVVLVAAAGNGDADAVPYPASDEGVVAVGASNGFERARFSNFGPSVDIWAPGVGLVSAMPGGTAPRYARWAGSSFAAALVAGACANLAVARPGVTPDQITEAICSHGPRLRNLPGPNDRRIDVFESLAWLLARGGASEAVWLAPVWLGRARGSYGGSARLRLVGGTEEVSISATGFVPGGRYALAASIGDREEPLGVAQADVSGVLAFVAPIPRAADHTEARVKALLVRGIGVAPDAEARFDVEEDGVWLYGWTWLASTTDPEVRASFNFMAGYGGAAHCSFDMPFTPPRVTYAVRVDGVEVARQRFTESASRWVTFAFSPRSQNPVALALPPALRPVTAPRRIEIYRIAHGAEELVFAGDVAGVAEP